MSVRFPAAPRFRHVRDPRSLALALPAWLVLTGAAHAQNLMINGDFELGSSTGWTGWGAGWGSNDPPQYDNTEPGRQGNYCLRLSTPAQHSFGVYQQVPVTPGKTYRIDASWKGQRFGDDNWYEILIIDGPFSLDQAATPAVDKPNFMFAYDKPNNPLTADFGWVGTADQIGT